MNPRSRNVVLVAGSIVIAFGAGAGWQFMQARSARASLADVTERLESTSRELEFERLEAELAMATVAAQLGNYERSRQLTSEFFTSLQSHLEESPESARPTLSELLAGRDATITSLSRAQPESGLELTRLLAQYRQAMGRDAGGLAQPPASGDTAG